MLRYKKRCDEKEEDEDEDEDEDEAWPKSGLGGLVSPTRHLAAPAWRAGGVVQGAYTYLAGICFSSGTKRRTKAPSTSSTFNDDDFFLGKGKGG